MLQAPSTGAVRTANMHIRWNVCPHGSTMLETVSTAARQTAQSDSVVLLDGVSLRFRDDRRWWSGKFVVFIGFGSCGGIIAGSGGPKPL